jgi:amidohydrolase
MEYNSGMVIRLIRPHLTFLFALAVLNIQAFSLVDKTTAYLIDEEIKRLTPEIIKIRRFLHMNPELSNREYETSKLVASQLLSMGLEVKTGIAKTGVIGLLHGNQSGITVAFRADMDALPIQERTQVPYRSLNTGIMHACGHDVHTAIALGAAQVLSRMRDRFSGSIKFIFQPAEEGSPAGEDGGAGLMIKEGALDDPPVRAIFGLHVWPDIPVGQVLYTTGPALASADGFEILLKGKSAHGARPYEGIDTIVLASQLIMAVHTTLNRTVSPGDPAVVSFGQISGGLRSNIIAEEVRLSGTVRTLTESNRQRMEHLLDDIARGVTQPVGAGYEFRYTRGTPPVYNHPDLAEILLPTLHGALGKDNVSSHTPQMVAEDFSEFSQQVPGLYFLLGVKPPGARSMPPLHNPSFNPDERSLAVGIRAVTHLLLDSLTHQHRIED